MTISQNLDYRKDEIIQRIKSGESTNSIAKDFKCNPGTIWYFLKARNISPTITRSKVYGQEDEYKDIVLQLADQNISAYKIGKQLNISKHTILRWLKKWGRDSSQKCKTNYNDLLKDKTDLVIELHKQGLSCNEIGKRLNHSGSSVLTLLHSNGYDVSGNKYKYSVDEKFFESIDNEEKAYILGWMYSDGNVTPQGLMRICLHHQDEEILQEIKSIMQYSGPLLYKPARNTSARQVELGISRKKIVDDLINLGCVPNKSLILKFPTEKQVPKHLCRHFVRGYFDGDGHVSNHNVNITSSYFFCKSLNDVLPCKSTNIYQRYKDRLPEDSAYQLHIGTDSEIIKFLQWIYTNATIYLQRKYNVAYSCYQI